MYTFFLRNNALALCAFSAFATGCSSASSQATLVPNSATLASPNHFSNGYGLSRVPGVAGDLVYIATGSSDTVYYSTRTWKQEGTLTHGALTMCTDSAQDVLLPAGAKIYIYKHGVDTPYTTLKDKFGAAFSCATDADSLAVVTDAGTPSIVIYPYNTTTKTWGKGKPYLIENAAQILFAAYDGKGDLFVDCRTTTTVSQVSFIVELQKGASSFKPFHLNISLTSPFDMQYDGKYLAIMNTRDTPNVVYQFSISGFNGTKVGQTTLKEDEGTYQFWIAKVGTLQRLFATDLNYDDVRMYAYPGGGDPLHKISGFPSMMGVTVSLPPAK